MYKFLRLTDLCEYCEKGIYLKKKLIKSARDENFNFVNTDDNFNEMRNFFYQRAKNLQIELNNKDEVETLNDNYIHFKTIVDEIDDLQSILFHKNIAKTQRLAYSYQTKTIGKVKLQLNLLSAQSD